MQVEGDILRVSEGESMYQSTVLWGREVFRVLEGEVAVFEMGHAVEG